VEEVLGNECAHRTYVHDITGVGRTVKAFFEKRIDDRTIPTLNHSEPGILSHFIHEAHTPRAHHTAVSIKQDVAAKVISPEDPLRLLASAMISALCVNIILEFALAGLVTDRAIQGVVLEIKLENPSPLGGSLITLGMHNLPIHGRRRARRHQFGHSLDFYEAKAALCRARKSRMIAVMRDAITHHLGGLKEIRPLGDRHLLAVNGQCDRFHRLRLLSHAIQRNGAFREIVIRQGDSRRSHRNVL
jgi:hypothetical protein